jgi:AcrR family transcriptional regulator
VATAIKEDVKKAILDATERLLARYGYRKMTVEDIAQEVGIGKGSIYLYFTSKEELVLSHVDRIVQRLTDHLRSVARAESSAAEKLREMILARVLFRFDGVQRYTKSLNDLLADLRPNLLARRAKHFDEEAQIFKEVLTSGQAKGELTVEDPLSVAYCMLNATNSLLPYSLSTSELGERGEVRQKAAAIADLMLRGLVRAEDDNRTDDNTQVEEPTTIDGAKSIKGDMK